MRSRASKTVSHEAANLEFDALADEDPLKGVTDKIGMHVCTWLAPSDDNFTHGSHRSTVARLEVCTTETTDSVESDSFL